MNKKETTKKTVLETSIFLQIKQHLGLYYSIMKQQNKDFKTCFFHDCCREIQLALYSIKNAYMEKGREKKCYYLSDALMHLTNLEVTYDTMISIRDFNANLARRLLENLSISIVQCNNWLTANKLEQK